MTDAPSAPAALNVAGLLGALESEIALLRCVVLGLLNSAGPDDLRQLTEAVEAYALRWTPSVPVSAEDKALLLSVNAGRAAMLLGMLRQHPAVRAAGAQHAANDTAPKGPLQ